MRASRLSALLVVIGLLGSTAAEASSFRVAPVGLKINPGAATSSIRLWGSRTDPVSIQVRIFRSKFVDGEEWLEPTSDVVASPPVTKLAPGGENLVRIVRVSKSPVTEKESYRLLVDELPNPSKIRAGRVNVLVRHSIPVVFLGSN
ncbi:MAG: molecular chaperone [Rhizobiaceae bacterium]|nr:molecular chaperone [Rhizobiaceae bacterium]